MSWRLTDERLQDGKSNYLEGAMLIGMYIIIALAFVSFCAFESFPKRILILNSMSTRMMLRGI